MTHYDLISLSYRLGHTKSPEQARAVIDSYPEIKGLSVNDTLDFIRFGLKPKNYKPPPDQKEPEQLPTIATPRRKVFWDTTTGDSPPPT
jgi:hypothetical protein